MPVNGYAWRMGGTPRATRIAGKLVACLKWMARSV